MSDALVRLSPVPLGARCALHPERIAAHTCVRCGDYLCSECTAAGARGLCAVCEGRLGSGFSQTREDYSLEGLLRVALARWKERWPLLLGCFGGGIGSVYAANFGAELAFYWAALRPDGASSPLASPLHPAQLAFHGAISLVALALGLLLAGVCLDLLEGRRPALRTSLRRLRVMPHALVLVVALYTGAALDAGLHYALYDRLARVLSAWSALSILAGTWLLLLPLRVYVGLGVLFSPLVLLVEPNATAWSALRDSWRLVSGQRFETLGITAVGGLIVVCGAFACCVGALVALPLVMLLQCGLFLALRNPGPRSAAL